MAELKCWKCHEPITDEHPSDGNKYLSDPPQFAHARCLILEPFADKPEWNLRIIECLFDAWFGGEKSLYGNISFQDVIGWLNRIQLPKKADALRKWCDGIQNASADPPDRILKFEDSEPCDNCGKSGTELQNLQAPNLGRFCKPCLFTRGYTLRTYETNPIELQLLVIDLGDSCVVKFEKGETMEVPDDDLSYKDLFGENAVRVGMDVFCDKSFTDIRAAIDAMTDGEKPVPRIEAIEGNVPSYRVIDANGMVNVLVDAITLDTLSTLAGVELPVWKPRKGEWVKLSGVGVARPIEADLNIWRYTLKNHASGDDAG